MEHPVCDTCGEQLNAIEYRANKMVQEQRSIKELMCLDCSLKKIKKDSENPKFNINLN